ncbi:SDR family oxidoreductase [Enterococcus faecalis]|uniref:SDR family oxidoreductase n=1 Tax=Enterococcus faecalis TaxID=1351 RepID=UPI001A10715C|nr:SDR family oxidoreductase [Enterococcus faecalis]EGO6518569.1 SDR family oxidoreductase [Enterococcus faecalis]EGO8157485.1 SDR family oxidoreductase [Enterococcus faecalis]EGO8182953.1 SDR family oxidoreductase [Enterococcus faecalis]EGO8480281.1 SDR family oxidoreductase [Enterococcus faecalis]
MKNLLVVGSAGYLGRSYIEKNKEKYNFWGIDKVKNTSCPDFIKQEFIADVTNLNNIRKIRKKLECERIKLDSLLFSVGINPFQSFYSIDEEIWDYTFSVNLKSIVFMIKELYPLFKEQVAIVLIGSQNGVVGHEQRIDYGPSKAALIQLAKNLTLDFEKDQEKDIKVNVVSPSYILNQSNKQLLTESFEGKKLLKKIPLKKFVQLEDVVAAIDFLLSDRSKTIRGQNIIVDYGYTIV